MSNWNIVLDSQGLDESTGAKVFDYLEHYGYLHNSVMSGAVNPDEAVATVFKAVADFQSNAGLPPVGTVDTTTLNTMNQPRCGCLDVQRQGALEARWRKMELTYTVQNYVQFLSISEQDDILEQAFQDWENVSPLKITRVISGSRADIVISTGRGRNDGFDGPSGTLAWAYLPNGNDQPLLMRFDLDEKWVKEGGSGILLRNVACHEFGHLLGLDHSRQPKALMAPFYSPAVVTPQLVDDIPRIQSLYGVPTNPPQPPTPPTPPTPGRKVVMFEIEGEITKIMAPGFTVTKN